MWMIVINLGLLILSTVFYIIVKKWIQRIHRELFGLSPEFISAFLYGYFGIYKIIFIVFILIPWLALLIIA